VRRENQTNQRIINELENNLTITQQLAEVEIKDNLELFNQIQTKKKKLKNLKNQVKNKLTENQKIYLKNLCLAQEQLIHLANTNQLVREPSERHLTQAKQKLVGQLTAEEINTLCQLQSEITKLELELEEIKTVKLEASIAINY